MLCIHVQVFFFCEARWRLNIARNFKPQIFYFLCTYCNFLLNVYRQGGVFPCDNSIIGSRQTRVQRVRCKLHNPANILQCLGVGDAFDFYSSHHRS